MKRLLVFSDSHGYTSGLQRIIEEAWRIYGHFDAYLHCGDGVGDLERLEDGIRAHDPSALIAAVRGNCDGESFADVPYDRIEQFGKARVFMTHGHGRAVKSTLLMLSEDAYTAGCQIALFGHTHEPTMEMMSVLLLNPGCAHSGEYLVLEIRDDGQPRIHLDRLRS
ncbi:MAG: YfcE family phosphodiesterase [Clostridia bacterium]|nr:YfcE family phosphodiesterase [Clostridia bacterium]